MAVFQPLTMRNVQNLSCNLCDNILYLFLHMHDLEINT